MDAIHRMFCLLLLLVGLLPAGLRADHIVGGEFQYECLGFLNDDPSTGIMRYRITINMYRDCIGEGALFDGNDPRQTPTEPSAEANISIYEGDRYYNPTRVITLSRFDPVSINLGNPCLVINEPICQEIGVYTFIEELPVSDQTYTFVYQRCCRNESIRNLINPRQIGATYFIQLTPEAQQRCNTSPDFNIDPPIAICINEVFRIDLGATDADGDSLSYKFCDPKLGGGTDPGEGERQQTATYFDDIVPKEESPYPYTSVPWVAPTYSVDNQLGVGSTLEIDADTGELSGVPIYPGTHVLGICVEEWTRGPNPVLLSETKREFQLSVSRCGNTVTADLLETEMDEQGRFFIRQCGPGPNVILNESTRITSITSYDWELIGPGGELLTGRDRDFFTDIKEVGIYEGVMLLNRESFADNCKDTAKFLLGVYPDLTAEFTSTEVLCEPEPIVFTNLSTTAGGQAITDYAWEFGDQTTVNPQRSPIHQYMVPGDFPAQLTITDENGCEDLAVRNVAYFPAPRTIILEPQDAFGCAPFTNGFLNRSNPIDDTYLFEWRFGDGNTSGDRDPVHTYENTGIYDVYLSITSPLGCFVDTTFRQLVDVREAPVANFEFSPEQPSNIFPDVNILDRSIGANSQRYVISDPTGEAIFSIPGPDFTYRLRDTSTLSVTQYVSHPSGCLDTITKDIRMYLKNTFHAPNAFTPNGDGLNDDWRPKGIWEGATGYRLRIWNRWGEKIFETDNFEAGWDGTYQGSNSPAGGYLWDVTFTNAEGDPEALKGGVVLIR
ncbi:PKD domain-containing protein [Neolewinella litorea]|uniref:T9SS type B sorting domain-containing protein n=1 Tax=Neolewinella litorea TaxID=2562452 RepID=A0A4S4NT06_9BACT|nr:PKD domain-containing protein [Neolewinella litorea]THH41588.1 T9SS type B sorting domain-containing protein [Neolewinella litorea]